MAPSSREMSLTSTTRSSLPLKTRVILLGDHGVGKSAFLASIMKGESHDSRSAKQVRNPFRSSGCTKRIQYGGKGVDVILHDTAGQERYRSLTSSYYRGTNGCLLFFNVHVQSSFDNLTTWLDDLNRYCTDKNPAIVLVGITTRLYATTNTRNMGANINSTSCQNVTSSNINSGDRNNNNNNNNNTKKGPSLSLRQLRNSFRVRKVLSSEPTYPYQTMEEHLVRDRQNSHSTQALTPILQTSNNNNSLNSDVNCSGDKCSSRTINNGNLGGASPSPSTIRQKVTLTIQRALLSKATSLSLPSLNTANNYNSIHQTLDSYHAYNQRHSRSPGNTDLNGSTSDDFRRNAEEEQKCHCDGSRGSSCQDLCPSQRVISEEQAQSFAYTHGISYREVDLSSSSDSSISESVLYRMVEAMMNRERRLSLWDCDSNIVIIKPSQETKPSLCKRCCSCIN